MIGILAVALSVSLPAIDSVRIESRWGGLGEPRAQTYTVMRRDTHYEGESGTVSTNAVARLAAAITVAPVDREAALRGIARREWVSSRANERDDGSAPVCSAEAKRLLRRRLTDPEKAVAALELYYSLNWTDDYPFISIDVTFEDRRTIHLESRSQHALMLPWSVDGSETWNPEIPRAIAGLLSPDAEPRLTDGALAAAYAQQVTRDMRGELDDLEQRCVHRALVPFVEKQFEIVRMYHGFPGWFTAYVRRADFPPNLVLTLVIGDADEPDAPAKLERAVQRTRAYVDLVRDLVAKHPEKHFAIWCADGVSVEEIDGAVRISEYDPASGIVSNPRIIPPDGSAAANHL